ncbi:MAG: NAD(P)/FAD-dependent oxidoreductase, partial [Lachnospiraceae bacterium]|nr:NAD(P)/FAD-dependent oxidoreductase [Lachnospiraceae bacterium]
MIAILQLKIRTNYTEDMLLTKIAKTLLTNPDNISSYKIVRRSIDARKKPDIFYVMNLRVKCANEAQILKKCKNANVTRCEPAAYCFSQHAPEGAISRPIIVGGGPAGLFCAYELAKHGYAPLLLERGQDVERRLEAVKRFWESGILDPESNVQFGEGGAGTFSDGKLNTLNKDPFCRIKEVLEIFVRMGAKESILYDQKPHLGTDRLIGIVKNLREEITQMGGEIRFDCKVTDLVLDDSGKIKGVVVNGSETIDAKVVVLAIGHSARDTFEMLNGRKVPMEAKEFAVGYRVMHPQAMIDESQYAAKDLKTLGLESAPYKLTAKAEND